MFGATIPFETVSGLEHHFANGRPKVAFRSLIPQEFYTGEAIILGITYPSLTPEPVYSTAIYYQYRQDDIIQREKIFTFPQHSWVDIFSIAKTGSLRAKNYPAYQYSTSWSARPGKLELVDETTGKIIDSVCFAATPSCINPALRLEPGSSYQRNFANGAWEIHTYTDSRDFPLIISPYPQTYGTVVGEASSSDSDSPSSNSTQDDNTKPSIQSCPASKPFDPESGECRRKSQHLKPCPSGYQRHSVTKRCRKVVNTSENSTVSTTEALTSANHVPITDDTDLSQSDFIKAQNLASDSENPHNPSLALHCPASKPFDPESGECRSKSQHLKPCNADEQRDPQTKRCRKIQPNSSSHSSHSASGNTNDNSARNSQPCKAGYVRNPETGRCKKVAQASTASIKKSCPAGEERNPATGRCRKIRNQTVNDGAAHPLIIQPGNTKKVFTAIGVVVLIILLTLCYIIYQFRQEIASFSKKFLAKFRKQSLE